MPEWLNRLAPILILLAVVVVVILRLPKVKEVTHSAAFKRRRLMNWLPLGLTYAFLYMGRYNLKVSEHVFEHMTNDAGEQLMNIQGFATIFLVGTVVYGFSFVLNGPLTDRFGGKAAILAGACGTALANLAMGLCTWSVHTSGPGATAIADNFVPIFSVLYAVNMYFQSFGAVAIVKVNAPWFHVRERGVFGAIFGILISLGLYFAYDWSGMIVTGFGQFEFDDAGARDRLAWVFFAPAAILGLFWLLTLAMVRNSPADAGLKDFDTADASSGDDGERLGAVTVFKLMLKNPVIMTIAAVEFCSGFLRQSIMQWYRTFAKHTDDALGNADSFVYDNWGLLLCCAGILGGVVAGVISDHLFKSRRGPVAAILYVCMLLGAVGLTFAYRTPIVGWLVVGMSVCVIGVHGMLSGTASMDFGGRKNVGVAVGIIDGFVYLGTAAMAGTYYLVLPHEELDAAGHITGPSTDPANWIGWPLAMIPVAVLGTLLAARVWNATPRPRKAPGKPA